MLKPSHQRVSLFVVFALFQNLVVAQNEATPAPRQFTTTSSGISATGSYERFRRVRVHVVAPLEFNGQKAKILESKHLMGSSILQAQGAQAVADVLLPMPAASQPYGSLKVRIGKTAPVQFTLPDIEKERQSIRDSAPLQFSPFVFFKEDFPTVEFEQPSLVEDALGSYTLHTTFYDANYNAVTRALAPGRYGAVVEVCPEIGSSFKRFVTLYRQDKPYDGKTVRPTFTGELPQELGVNPQVLQERSSLWSEFIWSRLSNRFWNDPSAAVLLAGLHESKPGDGSGSWNNPAHRDEAWWYGLKKKRGEVKPIRYLLDLPEGYDEDATRKWPLVIFLHGSGESGDDLSILRRQGLPKLVAQGQHFPFILVSPQAPKGYLLTSQIMEVLEEVEAKQRVDADRIYLTGLSMGGNGTWFTAAEFPERFAAIVPIAATTDPGNMTRLKHLPTWFFEGGKDDTITQERLPRMVEALKAEGAPFHFTFYPEAGHGQTWEQAYADPKLYEWMLTQKRSK